RVGPRHIAVHDLLSAVLLEVSHLNRRKRRASRRRKEDLLVGQLGTDLVVDEGISPKKESRAKDQDADEANLEHVDAPPHWRCHLDYLHEICFLDGVPGARFYRDRVPLDRLGPMVLT